MKYLLVVVLTFLFVGCGIEHPSETIECDVDTGYIKKVSTWKSGRVYEKLMCTDASSWDGDCDKGVFIKCEKAKQ